MDSTKIIEAPDFTALLTPADSGKWVALAPDYSAVWARAKDPKALFEALSEEERAQDPVFYRVPEVDAYYIPHLA